MPARIWALSSQLPMARTPAFGETCSDRPSGLAGEGGHTGSCESSEQVSRREWRVARVGCLLTQDVEHDPGRKRELVEEEGVGVDHCDLGANVSSGKSRRLAVTIASARPRIAAHSPIPRPRTAARLRVRRLNLSPRRAIQRFHKPPATASRHTQRGATDRRIGACDGANITTGGMQRSPRTDPAIARCTDRPNHRGAVDPDSICQCRWRRTAASSR